MHVLTPPNKEDQTHVVHDVGDEVESCGEGEEEIVKVKGLVRVGTKDQLGYLKPVGHVHNCTARKSNQGHFACSNEVGSI